MVIGHWPGWAFWVLGRCANRLYVFSSLGDVFDGYCSEVEARPVLLFIIRCRFGESLPIRSPMFFHRQSDFDARD
jgi:hypothetical protein